MSLDFAPGATLSATIPAFSASLQRRRRGVPVRTSTRRKLCPSIGKLLGTRSPCSIKTTAAGSHHCRRPPQGGDQAPLTFETRPGGVYPRAAHGADPWAGALLRVCEKISLPLSVVAPAQAGVHLATSK